MRRFVIAALALLLLRADMFPDASNAKLPGARTNLGGGKPVSIIDHGAKADAVTGWDAVMAAGSTTLTSAQANFTSADIGKIIQVDGAAGVWQPPLKTTITAVSNAHTVTLAAPAIIATPRKYWSNAQVVMPRTAGSYVPGDLLPLSGGTSTTAAVARVADTKVTATTLVAGGTGGVDGACVVQGTTGSGTLFGQSVTVSGGAITALGSLVAAGHYFTKPTNLAAEPVANAPGYACAPSGATLNLTMGVESVYAEARGDYSVAPTNPVATGAGSISGATGATINVSWNSTGPYVYGTDDSAALKAAIDTAAAQFAADKPSYVFLPAGNYLIDQTKTPVMRSGLGVVGEGTQKTNIILGAGYAGDLFAWSEAWGSGPGQFDGTASWPTKNPVGPKARGFTVSGNRSAPAEQNALVFYDRNDEAHIEDIDVITINGRCLYVGAALDHPDAYMRESRFAGIRCFAVGSPTAPAIEFTSRGTGDATNEINISNVDVYSPYGTGFLLRSENQALRAFHISKLRIEGLQWAGIQADLLQIGHPAMTGGVRDIYLSQVELLSPYPNQAAVRLTAPNSGLAPYFVKLDNGFIGGLPFGYGVFIDQGRASQFHFTNIESWNTNVSTSGAASAIFLDGNGAEQTWTYSLGNPLQLATPLRKVGIPNPNYSGVAQPTITALMPDNSTIGGNSRGPGAVDWQTARFKPDQVASGAQAVVGGGIQNKATGVTSIVGGGNQNAALGESTVIGGGFINTATGHGTAIPGGTRVTDRGAAGGMFYASSCAFFGIQGSCQRGWHTFGGATNAAAPVRLTTDQGTPGAANCLNIPLGTAYQTVVRASLHNRTNHNVASWDAIQGLLYRAAGNAGYLGGAGGAASQSTAALGTLAVAADTTNQCLALTYTPPAGNADFLDITATVDTTEVQ